MISGDKFLSLLQSLSLVTTTVVADGPMTFMELVFCDDSATLERLR